MSSIGQGLSLDGARLAELRRSEAVVVLAELKAWLCEQASLPSLLIGKAGRLHPDELGASHALRRGRADTAGQ